MYVDFDTSGPVFGSDWFRVMHDITEDTEKSAGRIAQNEIEARFGQVFRTHPSGRAEASVDAHPVMGDIQVDMGGLVYGPWLEGVGSRNRTTRFKGYFTFRLIKQKMQGRIHEIAQIAYDKHKEWLGG